MKPDLNIVNGGSLAGSLRETGKVSNTLFWRDALYMGPLPLTDDVAFTHVRNEYWGQPADWILHTNTVSHFFPTLTDVIPRFSEYGRIVLWFEFDLYDQSMLWYILRQLQQSSIEIPPLYIISPDSFPGIPDFRGMGQLHPKQLEQFFGTEVAVTSAQCSAAATAWEVYTSADEETINRYAQKPNPLPFVSRALNARLA